MAALLVRRPALAAVLVFAISGLLGVRASAAAQQRAVFDLVVNGLLHGPAIVEIGDGEVWCDADALKQAGVDASGGEQASHAGRTMVRLGSLAPAIRFEIDERTFALQLTVPAALLGRTNRDLSAIHPAGIEYRRAPSGFLNYAAAGSTSAPGSLTLEGGVSAHGLLLTSTAFTSGGNRLRAGLTSLTIDDRRRMNRIVIGDAVASTGALGGGMQMAGLTISRDFSLDPYFVRYPTIGLSGAATTPSRVEVYVNDQLLRVEQIPPGTYELNHVPLPVGAANTRVVVRDAFGGQQEFDSSYYVSAGVLARGLQQFAYSGGVERRDPFGASWSYGRPAVLGVHRIGITDAITLGGRFEVRKTLANGGPSLTARVGRFGQLETIAAFSRAAGATGFAGSLAYEYSARRGGLAFAVRHASPTYTTVSTRSAYDRPRLDLATSVTGRLSRASLTLSAQALSYYAGFADSRRASVSTSIGLGTRASLMLTASRGLQGRRWDTAAFAGISVTLDRRTTMTVAAERTPRGNRTVVDAQRALPSGAGYGYHVRSGAGEAAAADLDGELRAQTSTGRYSVRQMVLDGRRETLVDASGALVLIGGGVHATRPVQDGYALVRVPGVRNVRTYVSRQEIGRTNRRGDLVVPALLPYYGNRLSIADADVPVDRDVQRNEALIAPPFRGGALALFPAPRQWRVTGQIMWSRGAQSAPATGVLTVMNGTTPIDTDLGSNGAYYLEGLGPGDYAARLASEGDTCEFTLHVPASDAPVIRAGISTCRVKDRP